MKLLLKNLRNGQLEFSESCHSSELELPDFLGDMQLSFDFTIKREKRWLRFSYEGMVPIEGQCDRCAIVLHKGICLKGEVLAVEGERLPEGMDPDEIRLIHPDAEELDLGPDIRDELLMAWEKPKLCKDDCLGLCSQCGQDLNQQTCDCVDSKNAASPFAGLSQFKTENK